MELATARRLLSAALGRRTLVFLGHRASDAAWLEALLDPARFVVAAPDWATPAAAGADWRITPSPEPALGRRPRWSLHRHSGPLLERLTRMTEGEDLVLVPYFASVQCHRWAAERRFSWAAPPPDLKSLLEDKTRLSTLLREAGLPAVPGRVVRLRDMSYADLSRDLCGHWLVIQQRRGSTGTGTHLVRGSDDFERLRGDLGDLTVRASRHIPGATFNINACNCRAGVAVAAPSLKAVGLPDLSGRATAGCGNDWRRDLLADTAPFLIASAEALGEYLLREYGYRGVWGADLVVDHDDGTPFVVDLNPRFQGTTVHESLAKSASRLAPLPVLHLLEFLGASLADLDIAAYNRAAPTVGASAGAYLKLYQSCRHPVTVLGCPQPGEYALDSDGADARFVSPGGFRVRDPASSRFVLWPGVPGRDTRVDSMALMGKVVSEQPLLAGSGELTAMGCRILAWARAGFRTEGRLAWA